MKVLLVIDMQNDFIDGALGTEEAVKIVPRAVEKIKAFDGKIWATRDTHEENYLDTQEGKNLPVRHCIRGTKGWEICPEIQGLLKEEPIDKAAFGSMEAGRILKEYHERTEAVESVTLLGLCTDICVISNAMIVKASLPEVPVIVDASCCAGVTPESHRRALDAMKACQIMVVGE
ncbi:MAG: cysteine hydrolase [Dorea sp.]|nr:cysteine hydrolase [Dorea sp.]